MHGWSYLHKIRGWFDTTKSLVISKTLEYYHRTNGINKYRRMLITTPIIQKLMAALPTICYSLHEAKLFAAIFISFHGLLRVSEAITLLLKNVSIADGHALKLVIEKSETDQHGHSTTLILHKQADTKVCPLHLMQLYLQVRPLSPTSLPLFIHMDGMPLIHHQFDFIMQKSLTRSGYRNTFVLIVFG
jgi:hypothetical protein